MIWFYAKPLRPKGTFVLDQFAGAGGVAVEACKLGRESSIVNATWDSNYDVCGKDFREFFDRATRNNLVAGVMIATPCNSFSLAIPRSGQPLLCPTREGFPFP